MSIALPVDRIFRRLSDLPPLLSPITSDSDAFVALRLPRVRDYTIGFLPFGYPPESVLDPASVRFPTIWEGIFFNYHERWVPIDAAKSYAMERAYLHIYLTELDDLQAVSLHCDPLLEPGDTSFRFKRGPHLHVAGATPDISRTHISICAADKAMGGNNLGSLTSTLQAGLKMLVDELIPAYNRHLESLGE